MLWFHRYALSQILLLLIFWSCVSSQTFAQSRREVGTAKHQLISELNSFQKRHRLASLSFAFFSENKESIVHATGYATLRGKQKTTPEHFYTIASLTKSITGMTLVDLVHQNYLSLGDSVHKLIAGFPKDVTVLDLLNHTSGFLREKENENYLRNSSYKQILDYLPVKFNLKIHRYANFNYAVAGAVIEKVTGQEFNQIAANYYHSITHENLFFYNLEKKAGSGLFADNYVRKGRRLLPHKPIDFGIWQPAAFAQTTTRGLARFLQYHMTPHFLEFIESHAVTIRKRKLGSGKAVRDCYSLGFRLHYENDLLKYVYHNGFLYGVTSTFYYYPEKKAGFVAISNMSSYPRQNIGLGSLHRIVEQFLDKDFNQELAKFTAQNGFAAGVKLYEDIRLRGEASESMLNAIASEHLERNEREEAIGILQLNNYLFPKSAATYERLADAYFKNGEKALAEEALLHSPMSTPATKSTQ